MHSKTDQLIHDVRGPLNTISINAELAKLLAQKSGAADSISSALDVILRECQRCNGILQEFGRSEQQETTNSPDS